MGQKVHPGGLRVGIIHDWKSNWYTEKEFAKYLHEDLAIRNHIYGKLSHAGLSDIHIRKDSQKITIDIYTARPGIVIGKSGSEVDALRKHIYAMTGRVRPDQHQRDQAPRAGRQADGPVRRRAAAEPRVVPPRHEAVARLGRAVGRDGRQGQVRRPPRRHGDVADRAVLGGPRAAPHAPRRHRLRLHRGQDDLRPHRREGLDQQGRDHARGLRGLRGADAARRGRCPAAPQRRPGRDHGGARADASAAPRPARPAGRRPRRRRAAIAAAAAPAAVPAARAARSARRSRTRAASAAGRASSPRRPARRRGTAERRPGRRSAATDTPTDTAGES